MITKKATQKSIIVDINLGYTAEEYNINYNRGAYR